MVVLETKTKKLNSPINNTRKPLRSFSPAATYRIVLRIHRLSERLRVFTFKYVVQQILALLLPGISVRQDLHGALRKSKSLTVRAKRPYKMFTISFSNSSTALHVFT